VSSVALSARTRLGPSEPLEVGGRGEISRAHGTKLVSSRSGPKRLALAALVLLAAVQAATGHGGQATPASDHLWLDAHGRPLPFQDHPAVQDAMRSARVVSRESIGQGVSGTEELLLEKDETLFHAAFRTVDRRVRQPPPGPARRGTVLRDSAIFECAAYELSQLLGMGRVPPVVERRIGTQDGTVQIWLEETHSEFELREQEGLRPPDLDRWDQQRQIMYAFDSLIANFDRNQGNVMLDRSWNMWFIDHTRAFKQSSELRNLDRLTQCEHGFWNALRGLDEDMLRQRLEPYLGGRQISNLLTRRTRLIRHFQALIDEHGEDAVLFDLPPPGAQEADQND
jgi:hypothetical protein